MPVYEYTALNQGGKKIKGSLEADSVRTARQRLRGQNIFPTEIKESLKASTEKTQDVKKLFTSDRVSLKQLTVATRLLATLSTAGLPLVSSLLALSEQVDSPNGLSKDQLSRRPLALTPRSSPGCTLTWLHQERPREH
jgi:general secretion pathway protein F